ncbi:hypothetical protein ASG04_04895 [Curtobacterium sp. Leaf183]|nr:hypothetical protein ASG04_04895 [Curtobacterium sp. Leaf183]
MVMLLGVVAAALWVVAIALPIIVLVFIGNLPGHDSARASRSLAIATGAFVAFALLAIPATVGFVKMQRARSHHHETGRHDGEGTV